MCLVQPKLDKQGVVNRLQQCLLGIPSDVGSEGTVNCVSLGENEEVLCRVEWFPSRLSNNCKDSSRRRKTSQLGFSGMEINTPWVWKVSLEHGGLTGFGSSFELAIDIVMSFK